MLASGLMWCTPEPSRARTFLALVNLANAALADQEVQPLAGPAFMAAGLAHADIPWRAADARLGFPQPELALDPYHSLRCRNAWRCWSTTAVRPMAGGRRSARTT
jgi:hypothetical protein